MAADLQAALTEIGKLKSECQEAKGETQAVRQKLHNAIRKGKALDAEKQQRMAEVQTLQQELEQARASAQAASGASAAAGEAPKLHAIEPRFQLEQAALQQRVEQLLAQEAQHHAELQEAARRCAEQERELESRLQHAQFLEGVSKAKQRELAAQQGECLMLKVALEAAQDEVKEARAAQPSVTSQSGPDPVSKAAADTQQVHVYKYS